MTAETALAKVDPMGAAMATFDASKFNLCAPVVNIDRIPDQYRISVRVVQVNPETETYPIPGSDKVGLSKVALDKLASAANIQWVPMQCGELPHPFGPHYCHYRAVGVMRNFDGETRFLSAEKVVDLRGKPGDPEDKIGADAREFVRQAEKKASKPWDIPVGTKSSPCRDCGQPVFWIETPNKKKVPCDAGGVCHFDTCTAKPKKEEGGWDRVFQARQNIHSLAESKAKNRAIRGAMAVPVAMPKSEVSKPFVIPALVLCPDMSDPQVKAAAIAHMFGASAALYGAPPAAPRPALMAAPTQEPIDTFADPETGELLTVQDPHPPAVAPAPQAAPTTAQPSVTITVEEFQRRIFGDEPEPWDEPAKPKRYLLNAAELGALDHGRAAWFARLNEICQAVYDRFGQDVGADHLAATFPKDWDPATTPKTLPGAEIAKVGGALKTLLGGR